MSRKRLSVVNWMKNLAPRARNSFMTGRSRGYHGIAFAMAKKRGDSKSGLSNWRTEEGT